MFKFPNVIQQTRQRRLGSTIYPSINHRFAFPTSACGLKMADVVMTDISAPTKKAAGKNKAGGSEGAADGKKRFEVKKVRVSMRSFDE